jgi:hypothetical protein
MKYTTSAHGPAVPNGPRRRRKLPTGHRNYAPVVVHGSKKHDTSAPAYPIAARPPHADRSSRGRRRGKELLALLRYHRLHVFRVS